MGGVPLIQMTPDEVRKHEDRVKSLYRSDDLTRNIAAILMDLKIGNAADHKEGALPKARAIVRLFRKQGLAPLQHSRAARQVRDPRVRARSEESAIDFRPRDAPQGLHVRGFRGPRDLRPHPADVELVRLPERRVLVRAERLERLPRVSEVLFR